MKRLFALFFTVFVTLVLCGKSPEGGLKFKGGAQAIPGTDPKVLRLPNQSAADPHVGVQQSGLQVGPTAVEELWDRFQLRIYPNPTSDILHLERGGVETEAEWEVSVFALDGKTPKGFKKTWPAVQAQFRFDVGALPSGMYYLVLQNRARMAFTTIPFVKIQTP